jgi:uncharacterized protein (DUF486 family)
MSLRAFHIFFIIIASLMAWGIAYIEYVNYGEVGSMMHLVGSCASMVAAVSLWVYAVIFFRKTRKLIL